MVKKYTLLLMAGVLFSGSATADTLRDQIMRDNPPDFLGGIQGLACEAVLCLSTGNPPSECGSSLSKYFSIVLKYPHRTIRARKDFLNLCPSSTADAKMRSLTNSMVEATTYCDERHINEQAYNRAITVRKVGGEYGYLLKIVPANIKGKCKDSFDVFANHEYTDNIRDVLTHDPHYRGNFGFDKDNIQQGRWLSKWGKPYYKEDRDLTPKAEPKKKKNRWQKD